MAKTNERSENAFGQMDDELTDCSREIGELGCGDTTLDNKERLMAIREKNRRSLYLLELMLGYYKASSQVAFLD